MRAPQRGARCFPLSFVASRELLPYNDCIMTSFITTSYRALFRSYPTRATLASFSNQAIGQTLLFLFVLNLATSIAWGGISLSPGAIATGLAGFFAGWYIYMHITLHLLNKYTAQQFSQREVLALSLVFGTCTTLLLTAIELISAFLGTTGSFVGGLIVLAISLYVFEVYRAGLREIAGITSGQAAYVILAPAFVLILFMLIVGAGIFVQS